MNENEQLQLFEDQAIRTAWDEENEEWYFSVVDVVSALTDAKDYDTARNYWKVTKKRLKDEGSQLVTDCNQLKLKSPKDGKRYKTDVANTQQLFRIIQSIPSPKAEPMKLWLAQVGRERIEETLDPERIAERLVSTYERKGYTREWINQRLQAISARKELTDEWKDRGIEKNAYSIPVLIRKYLQLNSSVLGFNTDHEFCDSLDALMLLDLKKVPEETILMLSKELADIDVLGRFKHIVD